MKKLVIALLALGIFGNVYAKAHGPAGCGLGSILFEGKEGTLFNVLAATFNSTSGNQTFGMSTGTLGCEDAASAKVTAVSFIEANRVALANDVARGGGETLNTYLTMINKNANAAKTLQKNYGRIFAEQNTPAQIHDAVLATF